MATNKRVFTLRLSDEVLDKIGILATQEHRSVTNYIEFVLLQHIEQVEKERGLFSRRLRHRSYLKFFLRLYSSSKSKSFNSGNPKFGKCHIKRNRNFVYGLEFWILRSSM